ncbi:bis(5'-nucleosyl)-tetraphosphatase (symmetrical) YqeK [Companilactobacillus paralimentarius]|uniref:bis(5'-nucleosyl)-tetraphosphatase (symmetrical) YqeK n=1 Tax=Companilactobacillus paralimentarius TaxID=83526 RepID=UPI0028536E81|nr:bis(5'-nucleosyl)-tetraphosphatase (symmetrical) YqeK [Companilactobacillus paralimentarius]MDR4934394.1 bis(5'-nucleosyl)-tetraphosphatase (symmetrical) YqeK [Companilactobacillus paralimentarius]
MDYIKYINDFRLQTNQSFVENIERFYQETETISTFYHGQMAAKEVVSLSKEYHEQLYQAGLLHDISAFIPKSERLLISEKLHIPVLKEEHQVPLLLHQKLSAYIAEKCFQIKDPIILNAIKCHTTLKKNFNNFDLIVFLADKIAWDQPGIPPYLEELNTALKVSYQEAALVYIDYLLSHNLLVAHPWLLAAKKQLTI